MNNEYYNLNLPTTNLSGKYIYSIYVGNDLLTDSITLTDNYDESRDKFLKEILPTILRWKGLNIPKSADVTHYWYEHHYKYFFEPIEWLQFKGSTYNCAKYNLSIMQNNGEL